MHGTSKITNLWDNTTNHGKMVKINDNSMAKVKW